MPDIEPDPKAGGMGAEAPTSAELMLRSHKALRDVLRALESLPTPAGGGAAFDDFKSKAQAARRALEDVDADLENAKSVGVTASASAPAVVSSNGSGSGKDVHIHLHLSIP
jgi:hypothetical protein